jgi:hypothetical protein
VDVLLDQCAVACEGWGRESTGGDCGVLMKTKALQMLVRGRIDGFFCCDGAIWFYLFVI